MTLLLDRLHSDTRRLTLAELESPDGWSAIISLSRKSDTVRLVIVEPVEFLLARIIKVVACLVIEDLCVVVSMKTDEWFL